MLSLASYFSAAYLCVYLPAAVGLYTILPPKGRRVLLLLFSYLFFWAVSGKLVLYLILSTLSIHHLGLWLADIQSREERAVEDTPKEGRRQARKVWERKRRRVVAFGVLLHVGILAVLKYSPFFAVNLNSLLAWLDLPWTMAVPRFVLPIGISFYTMQALSYIIDVSRKSVPADGNLFRLALYMSFFPQIMEGPICRYSQTAAQLWEAPPVCGRALSLGLQRILYGLMKKVVVADRLNLLIKTVFETYQEQDGLVIAAAAVCYTVQLYMDFSGTMDMALGTGYIFGVRLPENFNQPFCSESISEFWHRWHITLGTWFKDYVFYPISMSQPMKKLNTRARKQLGSHLGPLVPGAAALFCVWTCNGLWHGAAWNYFFFGMYHFALILLENLWEPWGLRVRQRLGISRAALPLRLFRRGRTALLVCVGELFFRADGLRNGLAMFKRMVTASSLAPFTDQSILSLGMDGKDWLVCAIALGAVTLVSALRERGISVGERLLEKGPALRCAAYYSMVLTILIFGAYGAGYVPVDPIYAGF